MAEGCRKVLIVDADVLGVIAAERVLTAAGFAVVPLLGGAGLLAKLEYEHPDVLLIDTATPGLQPEVIFALLHGGDYDDLVLVLFSAAAAEELEQVCIENESINGYFSKTMDLRQLPGFLESFFGQVQ